MQKTQTYTTTTPIVLKAITLNDVTEEKEQAETDNVSAAKDLNKRSFVFLIKRYCPICPDCLRVP